MKQPRYALYVCPGGHDHGLWRLAAWIAIVVALTLSALLLGPFSRGL